MLRAVDVQQVLMQTTSVERLQQAQQQQSDFQQRYVALQASEEKKLVKESDETEKARIQREEERERKRKMTRDHQKAEDKPRQSSPEEAPLEEGMGGRINIRA
jgi:hypothetical protein